MTTANLGLTLPVVGADADTWGTELNTDLGLIDARLPSIAFSAYAASTQAISSGVATKITLGTELFDTAGYFASSKFLPLVAGYYQINGTMRASDSVAITAAFAAIYKNGSSYRRSAQVGSVANGFMASVGEVIHFNGSTDYVELFGFITGSSPSFDFASLDVTSAMSGAFLSP